VKIKLISRVTRSGTLNGSHSIKEMLLNAGYTKKEILELKTNGKILVALPLDIRFLGQDQELYVIEKDGDLSKEVSELSDFVDKGYLIDLE